MYYGGAKLPASDKTLTENRDNNASGRRQRNSPRLTWISIIALPIAAWYHLDVPENRITALIGPSGCGKSTFLRTLNRMHETVKGTAPTGRVLLDGEDVLAEDVNSVRLKVGMVFQRSNPFPKTIFENVAYGLRVNPGGGTAIQEVVETSR